MKEEIKKKIEGKLWDLVTKVASYDGLTDDEEFAEVQYQKQEVSVLTEELTIMVEEELKLFVAWAEEDMGFPVGYESVLLNKLRSYLLERKVN